MKLKSLRDTSVEGKTILYRSPYDIGIKKTNSGYELKDDARIKATLPTLNYLLEKNCKIVILTWVGRPDGKVVEELKTDPHAAKVAELLGVPVNKVDDCIGEVVKNKISQMKPRDLLMLENVRFHLEEMTDNDEFAKELAENGEIVVFDGFPQAHRVHSSTTGILRHLPSCAGLYLEEEINSLSDLLTYPAGPFTVIIGGAKISDKVDAIDNLYDIADIILVGGGVANVFLKAEGKNMGSSFIEDTYVDEAKKEKKDWVVFAKEIQDRTPKVEKIGKKLR